MAKLIVVENDPVKGTDTHNIQGLVKVPPPTPPPLPLVPIPYIGTGRYEYMGKMTTALSTFVTIQGAPVAMKSSQSTLDSGEAESGKHAGPQGTSLVKPTVPGLHEIVTDTLLITDPVGIGKPSASAGSAFVTINHVAVLLNGDSIDSCDGMGAVGNSSVTADNQGFVFCSK